MLFVFTCEAYLFGKKSFKFYFSAVMVSPILMFYSPHEFLFLAGLENGRKTFSISTETRHCYESAAPQKSTACVRETAHQDA